jgi:ABC-type sugar transport system permease subunit
MALTEASPAPKPALDRPARRPRAQIDRMDRKRQRWGWLFVAPFAIVFVTFLVAPLAYAFWMSMQTSTLATGTSFTWFANYGKAFTDPIFLGGLGRVA